MDEGQLAEDPGRHAGVFGQTWAKHMQRSMLHACGRTLWTWKSGAVPVLAMMVGLLPGQTTQTTQSTTSENTSKEGALVRELQRRPGNGDLWFDLGVVRAKLGESDAAITAFQHAATLSTDKLAAYRNVIALAISKNDFPLAVSTCRRALARYPTDVELLQNDAYVLMRTSEFKEARVPLSMLKQMRPTDVAVRLSLITALQNSGDTAQSEVELNALLAESLLSRAQAIAVLGDFRQRHQVIAAQETAAYLARRWPAPPLDQSRQVGAEIPSPANGIGAPATPNSQKSVVLSSTIRKAETLIESEQYLEAMQFLDGARAQFPNEPDLEYQSALTDICLQRYAESVARLQHMKQQGWDSAKVEFLLGGAFEVSGELQDAGSAYRAAIAADPEDFMYYRALGALLQKEGAYIESSGPLQKALVLQPDDSGTLILLAKCREKGGDVDGAISLLEHAVHSDPGSRRAHALLSVLYSKRSRVSDAEKEQAIAATLEDQKIQQWTIWGAIPQIKN